MAQQRLYEGDFHGWEEDVDILLFDAKQDHSVSSYVKALHVLATGADEFQFARDTIATKARKVLTQMGKDAEKGTLVQDVQQGDRALTAPIMHHYAEWTKNVKTLPSRDFHALSKDPTPLRTWLDATKPREAKTQQSKWLFLLKDVTEGAEPTRQDVVRGSASKKQKTAPDSEELGKRKDAPPEAEPIPEPSYRATRRQARQQPNLGTPATSIR